MDKEKQAWRTIVAILQETGYDKLYDEEVHIVAEYLRRCEQQCKKQKEVIDKAIEYIKEKQKIQYKFALSHIECDDLLQILDILKEK